MRAPTWLLFLLFFLFSLSFLFLFLVFFFSFFLFFRDLSCQGVHSFLSLLPPRDAQQHPWKGGDGGKKDYRGQGHAVATPLRFGPKFNHHEKAGHEVDVPGKGRDSCGCSKGGAPAPERKYKDELHPCFPVCRFYSDSKTGMQTLAFWSV